MRRRVFPRIILFSLISCVTFILLAGMQFSRQGNFSQRIGRMTINGRLFLSDEAAQKPAPQENRRTLDGGASVFFGGLEFRLDAEYVDVLENEAIFTLTDGGEISFASMSGGGTRGSEDELRISGKFPAGIAAIDIPFRPQRSSVIRDGGGGMLNIAYNGSRYRFSRPLQGLDEGMLTLLASAPSVLYRAVTDDAKNNPADFIVPQAETVQSFNGELSLWTAHNFELWERNMETQTGEDLIVAWCAEAIRQGKYQSAASTVPAAFSTSPERSWESSVYQFDRRTGVWERFARVINTERRERIDRITGLLAEKNTGVFAEDHLIEYLAISGNTGLIDELAAFAQELDSFALTLETGCGILECYADMGKWRPLAENPFEELTGRAGEIAAEGLHRAGDQVFVFSDGRADITFNMRLGAALHQWGQKAGESDWAALGRSLVLSVLSLGDENGLVPAALTIGAHRGFAKTADTISTARLYRLLGGNEYIPRMTATGTGGIWAWTAASSVTVTQNETQMDIRVTFPVGETHYIALRSIRPFPLLQIYDANWRRAYDFESYYDSSGWYYFESEQTLVLKIRHRQNVENIRILFVAPRVEPPPPPPEEEPEAEPEPPQWQPQSPYQYYQPNQSGGSS